jgi:hypothetical protein
LDTFLFAVFEVAVPFSVFGRPYLAAAILAPCCRAEAVSAIERLIRSDSA